MKAALLPGNQRTGFTRACTAILVAILAGTLADNARAESLFIGSTHSVVAYDLKTDAATTVWSDGYSYLGSLGYDVRQDHVYYYHTQGSYYKWLRRDTDPGQFDPSLTDIETELSINDNAYGYGGMDIGPQSTLAMAYTDVRSPSTAFTRPTGVFARDVATDAQITLYSAPRWQIIGWQGYYNPSPIWGKTHEVSDVSVDPASGQVYFTDMAEGTISRVPLDGSTGREIILSGLNVPQGLAVYGDAIYWTETGGTGAIRKSDLLGQGVTDLLFPSVRPYSIAVGGGEIFWTDDSSLVQRANLDGSNARPLAAGAPAGSFLAFGGLFSAPEPSTLAALGGLIGMGLLGCWRRRWRRRR